MLHLKPKRTLGSFVASLRPLISPLWTRSLWTLLSIMPLIALIACSPKPQELLVSTVPEEIERPKTVVLPMPTPVDLTDVTWVIVTRPDGRYIALTPDDFEALQLNQADVVRYIRESRAQLIYYRKNI